MKQITWDTESLSNYTRRILATRQGQRVIYRLEHFPPGFVWVVRACLPEKIYGPTLARREDDAGLINYLTENGVHLEPVSYDKRGHLEPCKLSGEFV